MSANSEIWNIVLSYYNSGEIARIISSVDLSYNQHINAEMRKDMEQDVVEYLAGHSNQQKIIELHQNNKLCNYICGIVKKWAYASGSNYNTTFVKYEKRKVSINNWREQNAVFEY